MVDMHFIKGYMMDEPFRAVSDYKWKNYYILGDRDIERHHEAYVCLRVGGHAYTFRINREGELTVEGIKDGQYYKVLVKKFGPRLDPKEVVAELARNLPPD